MVEITEISEIFLALPNIQLSLDLVIMLGPGQVILSSIFVSDSVSIRLLYSSVPRCPAANEVGPCRFVVCFLSSVGSYFLKRRMREKGRILREASYLEFLVHWVFYSPFMSYPQVLFCIPQMVFGVCILALVP